MYTRIIWLLLPLFWACAAFNSRSGNKITGVHYVCLTYNIRYDNPGDGPDRWELRREALAEEVLRSRPDIIGLQEALLPQLQFLESRWTDYSRVGQGRDDGRDKGEFSPVLYNHQRFRLLRGHTFWLSPTPSVPSKGWDAALPRIATMAVLQDIRNKDTVWVINTHFDHIGKMARLHAAEQLLDTLRPILARGQATFLMGDLNTEPHEAPVQLISQYMQDACPSNVSNQGTFNGFALEDTTHRRIDYLFYMPNTFKFQTYTVSKPKINGRQVSDHYPVLMHLAE
jgi:endonuclease/exonuclease/phosphatase family metal-dependent hydrolase